MKSLTLLRHAKSTWDDPVARDFDRPLNAKGRRAAQAVGREMKRLELAFDAVLASPAVRVRDTLAEVSSGYGQALTPDYDQRIYLAATTTLLDIVRTTDDGVVRLLLVGHNPGMECLALLLAREEAGGLRSDIKEKYPTGTLAELSLPAERWRDIREGSGMLVRFIRPRDLAQDLGPDEDS